jgi:hypothetical protein
MKIVDNKRKKLKKEEDKHKEWGIFMEEQYSRRPNSVPVG